jgi:hypothetical protein
MDCLCSSWFVVEVDLKKLFLLVFVVIVVFVVVVVFVLLVVFVAEAVFVVCHYDK